MGKVELARRGFAKTANHFRELGTLLATLRPIGLTDLRTAFLAPNSEEFRLPFSYEKARAIMNFAAKNSPPITGRILKNRPKLVDDIIRLTEMT
jgi:hypothetical protein